MAKILPHEQVKMIVSSRAPLGDDEDIFHAIELKVERGVPLSKPEEKVLERLSGKAKKWEDEVRSSSETEPENTLAG